MSLLCWNVAGRLTRLDEQAERIADIAPDVVCLQEIGAKGAPRWTELLEARGWKHVVVSSPRAAQASGRRRPLSVLTAARTPLEPREVPGLPWPERVLATCVLDLELINVHSPISATPGLVKVQTHEAVHDHLAAGRGPRVLCGDLNTPRKEHRDGRVWTFARTSHGHLRPERGDRWDRAELALIRGLEPSGFRDAFREVHGLELRELSWEWQRWGGGYRLDHLIVSEEVEVDDIAYLHAWRKAGLSDHSPLYATLAWPG
jgi:exonuclease III